MPSERVSGATRGKQIKFQEAPYDARSMQEGGNGACLRQ